MRVRVISYNIHRAIGVDRRFDPARVAAILREHAADVVLLQEVDEGVPRSRELDLARELADQSGYAHVAVGHNVKLRKGRYGNATLSRHPIRRERNIDLSVGLRKRRGCQHTEIELTGPGGATRRLEVFNLHLGLSARERHQQVGLLLSAPEFYELLDDVPCLVGGDLNDWRSLLDPVFTDILGFRCATRRLAGSPLLTYPSFFPQGALDRIYFRGRMRVLKSRPCRSRKSRVASDHLPVEADFELR